MKKIYLYGCIVLLLVVTSCDKWLDVRPKNQKTTDELFSTYDGFKSALDGCYIKLKDRNIYGERLTMTNIESMAQLWAKTSNSGLPSDYELKEFDYEGDNARSAILRIYSSLFNTIAQVNMLLNYLEINRSVIPDESTHAIIEGEAYAIRAFCHFDVLRLFGQLPNNASQQISLPYAEVVSKDDLPAYYSYDQFIAKIEADLNKAESLLDENDPIFDYTFDYLNSFNISSIDDITLEDDFLGYRQNRFNYWAVKALQARYYLYTGDMTKAYNTAKSIINAIGIDGNPLITLSGSEDISSGYMACPSECLMMLNAYDVTEYSPDIFGRGAHHIRDTHFVITQEQYENLFDGQNIASNNRYNNLWDLSLSDPFGTFYPTLSKYFNESPSTGSVGLTKTQIIPLIRLSEMYLIVMETTTDLNEANNLWTEYQLSHNVLITENAYATLEEVKNGIIDEYRREFYGEGQMFYTYKRLGVEKMLWRDDAVSESDYIVPLPNTEFDPNI